MALSNIDNLHTRYWQRHYPQVSAAADALYLSSPQGAYDVRYCPDALMGEKSDHSLCREAVRNTGLASTLNVTMGPGLFNNAIVCQKNYYMNY